ncbi:5,6-dimethylbenzimidazole synthase [Rhodococcus sp. 05-2254-4]|jgi:5,6-dimethylbenzimidazole synthase|nr:5,6-dimethylbenzimidazole synthase [Rhodococcus sp. EPR-147]KZF00681.1 5,6-dimethylbenzimidazole synthase [Rhodococcus sp. EPR-279]OZE32852.1 5,6-dimethylbenzimidazole synthase [Rhodococcus sp. 05-2254-4]OZE44252.1 5,6-dimethylbenzimidazole synthase [Rhodococcus sp. 05-2254-3]OZE56065.1 5,6-dimethylbenzimidazole synthase [Rhodococcus sp. 05-2254-2]
MTEAALSVYAAIRSRRDVRAEFDGTVVDDEVLRRILGAAHQAPSVGNTQPWDFVVVRKPDTLSAFAAHVAGCRQDFADKLDAERRKTFDPIRIEGIETSGTGVVVTYDPDRGGRHVLGRDTVDDTGLFSAVLAIENLWLAAIAENVGVGWVSFYDEAYLTELLDIPAPVRPIAWLCVGPVQSFQEVPDLERFGWRSRRPLDDALHFEQYRR